MKKKKYFKINKKRDRPRTHYFKLRLNDEEEKILTDSARKVGISKSSYIRALLLGKTLKEKQNIDFYECLKKLNKLEQELELIIKRGIYFKDKQELETLKNEIKILLKDLKEEYI